MILTKSSHAEGHLKPMSAFNASFSRVDLSISCEILRRSAW